MAEYPDSKTAGRRPQDTNVAKKSSDVLTERLMQIRQRAEQAEEQRDEALARNRELSGELDTLHDLLEQYSGGVATADHGETEALRQELMQVREQAAADLSALQRQLSDHSRHVAAAPNVELEAELQAARQETAMLRQAVKEKDKQLEEMTHRFRNLEDILEKRDREMERLHQDLARSRDASALSDDSGARVAGVDGVGGDADYLYVPLEKTTSRVHAGAGSLPPSSAGSARRRVWLAATGGLLIGVLGLTVVLLLSDENGTSPVERAVTPHSQRFTEAPTPPRAKAQSQPATVVENKVAKSTVGGAPATSPPALVQDPLRNGSQAPPLAAIAGGAFIMGNKRGPLSREEQPAHRVELGPFYMGKYEVTFAQYDLFARATARRLPDDSDWGRGDRPVTGVSWDDAVAYTRWLSEQTGKSYRLPTEAEWEYAARGGSASRYWWGSTPVGGRAVCFDCGSEWDGRSTAPVGSLAANPYGLYDTAGNVMEWVADCYNPDYKGAPENGSAWLSGDCSQRMVRGGAFNKPSSSLSSAARYQLPRDARFNMLGFRVVRE